MDSLWYRRDAQILMEHASTIMLGMVGFKSFLTEAFHLIVSVTVIIYANNIKKVFIFLLKSL